MTRLSFLGTGNFLASGRYWNSFVLDGAVLVEPAPTALPHLRKCEVPVRDLDAVVISHFHPDHTFGWPFLLLELLRHRQGRPLFVVGPPGVEEFLADMAQLGGIPEVHQQAHEVLDVRYVVVDGSWQQAGALKLRAVEVEHVPSLQCYGYVFDRAGRMVGYSGDTRPCAGLDDIAASVELLVLECDGAHASPTHMDVESVHALHQRFPDVQLVLSHLGDDVEVAALPYAIVPDDLQTLNF